VWVDRQGKVSARIVQGPLNYPRHPRISPDGKRLVLATEPDVTGGDLWVYDLANQQPPYPLELEGFSLYPLWSPDSSRVVFGLSSGSPVQRLFWVPADGSTLEPEPLSIDPNLDQTPQSWSPDGQELIFLVKNLQGADLRVLAMEGQQKPRHLVETNYVPLVGQSGALAALSPDGDWLAYVSSVTGQLEIWIRAYPGSGAPVRISPNGGNEPVWGPNGRELFYLEGNKMMVVKIEMTPELGFQTPEILFEGNYDQFARPSYDVGPDGRFLMIQPSNSQVAPAQIHIITNWFEELNRLVPIDN
jgi:Tol biopolymer transport system component